MKELKEEKTYSGTINKIEEKGTIKRVQVNELWFSLYQNKYSLLEPYKEGSKVTITYYDSTSQKTNQLYHNIIKIGGASEDSNNDNNEEPKQKQPEEPEFDFKQKLNEIINNAEEIKRHL